MLALLIISNYFLGTAAQASVCTGEFNAFKDCMTTAFDDLMQRSDMENKMNQIKECFAKGRCSVSNSTFSLSGQRKGRSGQCKHHVFEQLGKHIEHCINSKMPGMTFADLFVKKMPGSEGPFNIPTGGRKLGKFLRLLRNPDTCPVDTREQVQKCLKPIVEGTRGAVKQYVTELCASKDKCIVRMSPNCRQEFDTLKKEVATCTCDHLEPNAAKYTDEFLRCIARSDQPNPMIKKMIEEFIPRFCQKMRDHPDVCQNLKGLIGRGRG